MNVTVYCGASIGEKREYLEASIELGSWIANNGHKLVYGAGSYGLMGAIANSVLEKGGAVIGVIPKFLKEIESAHEGLSEIIIVDTMTERKLKMFELGDLFIALPGGIGTLEEIAEVTSWAKIGKNNRPCIYLNICGYYNNLKKFYDDMVSNGFLSQLDREKIIFVDTIDEIKGII